MSIEIERKFTVNKSKLILSGKFSHIIQGYLSYNNKNSVRVRQFDDKAFLAIKSGNDILIRDEYEYQINIKDAGYMFKYLCLYQLIEKKRYEIVFSNHIWLVDVFDKQNKGLMVAEIELKSKYEEFVCPEWVLNEVTNKPRYYNRNLAKYPYSLWGSKE